MLKSDPGWLAGPSPTAYPLFNSFLLAAYFSLCNLKEIYLHHLYYHFLLPLLPQLTQRLIDSFPFVHVWSPPTFHSVKGDFFKVHSSPQNMWSANYPATSSHLHMVFPLLFPIRLFTLPHLSASLATHPRFMDTILLLSHILVRFLKTKSGIAFPVSLPSPPGWMNEVAPFCLLIKRHPRLPRTPVRECARLATFHRNNKWQKEAWTLACNREFRAC